MFAQGPAAFAAQALEDLWEGRAVLLWPTAFGVGAAVYFALPTEPPDRIGPAVLTIALLLWGGLAALGLRWAAPVALLACVAGGFLAADLRVDRVTAPALVAERSMTLTGRVERVEDRGQRGHRLVVALEGLEPPPRGGMPQRARLTLRSGPVPLPGMRIRILARLGPPQAPVYPGGYDFARQAFFERIGAAGFALGAAEVLPPASDDVGFATRVEAFRLGISARIRAQLDGDAGAIAAALIVGDRGSIDPDADEAMRISGLSHVLSISGLHMSLVAATIFAGLRLLLSAVPFLALRLPVRAIAACAAIAGALAYLVIAGLSLPTQRSAVMISVAFGALVAGRRALSLRSVAIAGLIVLLAAPEAVLDPGAQMSFAAVIALVAAYEALAARRSSRAPPDVSPVMRLLRVMAVWLALSALTSLVAGLATTPIALHHFNRLAPLGILANVAATPLVAFLIMPAALLAALLMPLGLDGLPLAVMGLGIDGMLAIAETVAAVTPSGGIAGRPPLAATMLVTSGGLWIATFGRPVRMLGLLPLLAGLLLLPAATPPDLVVAGDGRRALATGADGRAILIGRPDDFETAIWLAAVGDPRDPRDPSLVRGVRCDPEACIWQPQCDDGGPGTSGACSADAAIAVVFRPAAFGEECAAAGLVISGLVAPAGCLATTSVIDATLLESTGAATFALPPAETAAAGSPPAPDSTDGAARGGSATVAGLRSLLDRYRSLAPGRPILADAPSPDAAGAPAGVTNAHPGTSSGRRPSGWPGTVPAPSAVGSPPVRRPDHDAGSRPPGEQGLRLIGRSLAPDRRPWMTGAP